MDAPYREDKVLIDLDNINQGRPQTDFSDPYVYKRALMTEVASGGEIPFNDAAARIQNQQELDTNRYLVNQENVKIQRAKAELLQNYVKNSNGAPVSEEVMMSIRGLAREDLATPETINTAVERNFAKNILNRGLATSPKTMEGLDITIKARPEQADGVLRASEEYIANKKIAERILEDTKGKAEKQSWLGWGVDIAKTAIPGYSWYKKHNITGISNRLDTFFPGSNMQAQIEYLYTLPPDQFDKVLSEAVARIAKDNIPLAEEFAAAAVSFTTSQKVFDNAFGVFDAATIGEVGVKLGAKAIAKKYSTKIATKDIVEAAASPHSKAEDILVASGDIDTAALINAGKQVTQDGRTAESVKAIMGLKAPSITNPDGFFTGKGALAKETANDIAKGLKESGEDLVKAITRPFSVARLETDSMAVTKGIEKVFEDLKAIHGVDPNRSVIDHSFLSNTQTLNSTNTVNITLGDVTKKPFDSYEMAEKAATDLYNLNPKDFSIAQEAGGFTVKIARDIDEYSDAVRDVLIDLENKTPTSFINSILGFGRARSANSLLSPTQVGNRNIAVNAAEEVKAWIDQANTGLSTYLRDKDNYKNLSRMLEKNRIDRAWYNTDVEFEKEWLKTFGTPAKADDYKAYVEARRLSDLDYVVRNSEVYSAKASRGVMKFEVNTPIMNEGTEAATRYSGVAEVDKPTFNVSFEGKIVDELPARGEKHRILIVGEGGRTEAISPLSMSESAMRELYDGFKKEGYKFVQVWDVKDPALKQFITQADNAPINFVVSKEFRSSRLDVNQLPYVPGGHVVYESGFYMKQPQITGVFREGKWSGKAYQGDMTFSAHRFEKEGKAFHVDFEKARKIFASGDEQALANYVSTRFGFSVDEFKGFFGPGGFDKDTPFVLVRDGQSYKDVTDLRADGVIDWTDSSYDLASEMRTKFTSEKGKDVYDFRKGSEQNPVWRQEQARHLDPLQSLQRNLADITNSIAYKDYLVRSTNEWVEDFADLFNISKERLRQNPSYFFNNYESFMKSGPGVDQVRLAAAKQSATAIKHLISVPSEVTATVQTLKKKMVEFVFDKNPKAGEWLDEKLMATTNDPIKYLRAAAFHTKIGMFNPAHLFLQTQNLGNMAAISPKHFLGAYKDATLMRTAALTDNENVINYIAKKSGYKHFKEANALLKDSGFLNLNGNMAISDALAEPTLFRGKISNTASQVLDFGTVFFKSGEVINRTGAWNIAYREWRALNPTAVVDDAAKRSILTRADNLTTNMSRASMAQLQQGIGSVPFQFMTFQWRLMEQMWTSAFGKGPFTRGEMTRMLGFTGAMYGVPVGVLGPVTGVWPWQESFNNYAQENGIDVNANVISKTLMHGIYEQLFNPGEGRQYAISERFGPAGLPTIKDVLEGKKNALAVLTGVSGESAVGIYKAVAPTLVNVASVFAGPDKARPFAVEDVVEALRPITTINNATKAWMIYNYGLYESRTGVPIAGAKNNLTDALAQVFGISSREMANFYSRKTVIQDQAKALQEITKEVEREISRGLKADTQKDSEVYFKRARILLEGAGSISEEQRNGVFTQVLRKFTEDDIDTINRKWQMTAPTNEIQDRRIEMINKERTDGR